MARAAEVVLQLRAENAQLLAKLRQSEAEYHRSLKGIQRQAGTTGAFLRTAFAGLVTGAALSGLQRLSDAATRIDNVLKVAGLSGAELEKVYGRLRDSAVRNAAPLESMVTLFGRATMVQKELGATTDELIQFTDRVGLALRASGQSAEASKGALLQLGQALSTGVVRAEEYNSLQEGAAPILRAVAAGLKEAGGSVGTLTNLVKSGQVSSEAFFRAFEAGAPILEQMVANSVPTLSQAMGNLETAFVDAAREFNNSTGAMENAAEGVNDLAEVIAAFDISGFISDIQAAYDTVDRFADTVGNSAFFQWLNGGTPGVVIDLQTEDAKARAKALEDEVKLLQERIELNKELKVDNTEALARLGEVSAALAALQSQLSGMPSTMNGVTPHGYVVGTPGDPNALANRPTLGDRVVDPVSIKDFKPPSGSSGKGGKKTKQDDYAREVEQIEKRAAALIAETEAQRGLNPLIEDYGYQVEFAAAKQELLTTAKEAGKTITPELSAEIDRLAHYYATASAEAERLAEEQDNVTERAEFQKDALKGVLSDLRSAMADGKLEFRELGDIALNVLDQIISKIEDDLVDALFDLNSGGSGGGWLSKILGIFGGFKDGRGGGFKDLIGYEQGTPNTGGGRGQVRGVVHGQEAVIPLPAGGKVPVQIQAPRVPDIRARGADGGSVKIDASTVIDARGAGPNEVAELKAMMRKRDAALPGEVIRAIQEARRRNVKV